MSKPFTGILSQDETASYWRDGYVVLSDFIEPARLKELQEVTYGLIDQSRSLTASNDVFELDEGHSAESPRLTRIKLPHEVHRAFKDLLVSDKMVSLLGQLLGPSVRLLTSKLNAKAPGGGAAVEWHQDWAFYPHTNDDLLAVGVMLEDVTEENGPLMVIPGSHRGPILDHSSGGVFCGAIDPDDPLFRRDEAVTLTGRAGSISVHHVRALHGSSPNLSDRPRLMLFYECVAADAWPIVCANGPYYGKSHAETWADLRSRLICGEQPTEARLAAVPVRMPVPPPDDISSIFRMQKAGGARSAFARGQAAAM